MCVHLRIRERVQDPRDRSGLRERGRIGRGEYERAKRTCERETSKGQRGGGTTGKEESADRPLIDRFSSLSSCSRIALASSGVGSGGEGTGYPCGNMIVLNFLIADVAVLGVRIAVSSRCGINLCAGR